MRGDTTGGNLVEESMKKRFQGAEKALAKLHEGVQKESLTEMERATILTTLIYQLKILSI